MKNERRHQLERNELADRIGAGVESVQSYLPMILGGLVVLAVGALAWGLYSSSARKQAAAGWTEYYFSLTGGDADTFMDISEQYSGSTAASWAQQTAGNGYLQRGIEALYVDKSEGEELIQQAIDAFEGLENHSNIQLRTKAILGLAQAYESLGEIDKATGYYEELASLATQSGLVDKANERIAFLSSPAGKEFYAWFDKLDPQPAAPIDFSGDLNLPPTSPEGLEFGSGDAGPASAVAPAMQLDPADLPEMPQLQLEDSTSDKAALPPAPPATPGKIELPEMDLSGSDEP